MITSAHYSNGILTIHFENGEKGDNMNIFEVNNTPETSNTTPEDVAQAIDQLAIIKRTIKNLSAEKNVYADRITRHGKHEYFKTLAESGVPKPLRFKGSESECVLVVQERSKALRKDQADAIQQAAPGEVETVTTFIFDSTILSLPGVMECLSGAVQICIEEGVLSADQAARLIRGKEESRVKPGILGRLPEICDHDPNKIGGLVDLLKGVISIYPK